MSYQYLKVQRSIDTCMRWPETSNDFPLVDYACSELMMGAGHTYRVRFNDNEKDPRIVDVIEGLDA